MNGGNSDNGGLSNVNYNSSDNRNDNLGFRPLCRISRKSCLSGGILRLCPDPAAELASDFLKIDLQVKIFVFFNRADVLSNPDKDFYRIKNTAGFEKNIFTRESFDAIGAQEQKKKIERHAIAFLSE